MDNRSVTSVLHEWFDLVKEQTTTDVEPLIEFYNMKFKGLKIIDYEIDGKSIFIKSEEGADNITVTMKVDDWKDTEL